jgi:hypothetical protein
MGAWGSGRWLSHIKAQTVESCRCLDASCWVREGILKAGVWKRASCTWYRDEARTEQTSAIDFEANTQADPPWVRLLYTFTESRHSLDYRVRLTTTRPPFGGLRWWFVCPLVKGGVACGRRVCKLYLPPDARYFGCRRCHELTYTSCQTHDKRVDALRRNPEALAAIVNAPGAHLDSSLILALKALRCP